MNFIISLIVATSLFQGIICPKTRSSPPNRYPKNEEIVKEMESTFGSSLAEKFQSMDMESFMDVLSTYFDSKTDKTATPTNPLEPVSTPRESRITINNDSATRTPQKKTTANSKSNELSTSYRKGSKSNDKLATSNISEFEQNVDKKILTYKAGKTAQITADGTVKIDGTIIYKKIPELKSKAGYTVRAKNGKLTVNNKIIFKNDPKSKFKIPFKNKVSNFRSNTKSLELVITEDGSLKCIDNDNNVVWMKK